MSDGWVKKDMSIYNQQRTAAVESGALLSSKFGSSIFFRWPPVCRQRHSERLLPLANDMFWL